MKKKALILLLVLIVACSSLFALAACNKDDGKIHLTFYHTMGSDLRDVLNKYIAKFEAMYPEYKIDSKQVGSYDDVRDQIASEIMIGKQPNIAYCYPDHVALYNKAGAVRTLDDFISSTETVTKADGTTEMIGLTEEQKNDYVKGFYDEGAQFGDNKMYSLPFSKSTEVLYYNKTFMDQHKIPLPTHWWCTDDCPENCNSSMEKVCAAIKKVNSKLIPLGYDSEANWFITMCEQLGSPYTVAEPATKEGHFLFDNATNREFVKRFASWHSKAWVTTKALNNGAYISDQFKNKEAIMCIGSSAGAKYQIPTSEKPFEAGIANIPQVNSSNPKTISQGPSVCIFHNQDSEKVKMSWLFIKYLTTCREFQADFSLTSGYMPVIKSAAEDPFYKDEMTKANGTTGLPQLSINAGLALSGACYTSPAFYGSSMARDEVGLLMQTCFSKCKTLKDDQKINAVINDAFTKAINNCVQAVK